MCGAAAAAARHHVWRHRRILRIIVIVKLTFTASNCVHWHGSMEIIGVTGGILPLGVVSMASMSPFAVSLSRNVISCRLSASWQQRNAHLWPLIWRYAALPDIKANHMASRNEKYDAGVKGDPCLHHHHRPERARSGRFSSCASRWQCQQQT